MRIVLASVTCAIVAIIAAGCAVEFQPPAVVATVDAPVISAPGVVAVDVAPPPTERVYVYDDGFPPGVYLYGGFYYYHGYRYPHDVFINRYVHENIEHHRFDEASNHRAAAEVERRQREDYARNGGHVGRQREDHTARPREDHTGRPAETHTGRPAETHTGRPADTHTGRPTDTRTGRPTDTHSDKEKKTPANTPENNNRTVP